MPATDSSRRSAGRLRRRRPHMRAHYTSPMSALLRPLLLALALLAQPALAEELPAWFTESFLDLPDDVAEAAKQNRRVMLYFGQEGCPYCKRLLEVNFRRPATVRRM